MSDNISKKKDLFSSARGGEEPDSAKTTAAGQAKADGGGQRKPFGPNVFQSEGANLASLGSGEAPAPSGLKQTESVLEQASSGVPGADKSPEGGRDKPVLGEDLSASPIDEPAPLPIGPEAVSAEADPPPPADALAGRPSFEKGPDLPPPEPIKPASDDDKLLSNIEPETTDAFSSSPPPPSSPPSPPASTGPFSSWGRFFREKRRLAVIILVVGLALPLLFFLAKRLVFKPKTSPSRVVTLEYWGLWEPDGVVQGLIAQFEKENPGIKINYKFSSKQEYKARLQNSLLKGQGPDIFRFHQSWLPVFKNQLSPVPPSTVNALELEKDYFAVVPRSLKVGGRFWAVPLMVDNLALFYNKQLLEVTGQSPPRTWWGLQEVAKKVTTKDETGRIKIAGVALGTTGNVDHWSDIVGLMLVQNGVDLNKMETDRKSVEDVLRFYTLFYSRDQVWDNTLPSSTLAFATNKLVFYFAPSWRIFNLLEINPNLDFAVVPVPKLPKDPNADLAAVEKGKEELAQINWSSFWVEGVWSRSPHQKEAWKFLQFLASKKSLRRFYEAASQVRQFGEIYPVKSLAQGLKSSPRLSAFVDQADTSYSWYLSSNTYDDGPNDVMINYFADAINAIGQGEDPATAVETLLQGVAQVKSRYQLP